MGSLRCILILSISFFGLCQTVVSQEFERVLWGPMLDEQRGNEVLHTFATATKDFIVIRENKRKREGLIIERIGGDSLNLVLSKPLILPNLENSIAAYYQPLTLGGKTYLVATADDPNGLNVFIIAFELLESLDLAPRPIVLGIGSRPALINKNGFTLRADSVNNVLALLIPMEFQDGKNEKFELRAFDSDLKLRYEKKLEVPHSSENLVYAGLVVDSLNAIFVLTGIADPAIDTRNGRRNLGRDFSLFKYNWATEELKEKSLSLGTKWLYDVKMFRNAANNIQIAGYYSNMIDLVMAGTFSLELNRFDSQVINQGISPFGRDFRAMLRPLNAGGSDTELGMFYIDNAYQMDGGSAMIVSEKSYTSTTTIFNPATGTYSVVNIFNFDEVLVTSMTAKSKIDFAIMVPKYQSSVRGPGSYTSYRSFRRGDKTYIVFNDHERNTSLSFNDTKGIRPLNSASSAVPALISIDATGEMKRVATLSDGVSQPILDCRYLVEASDGVIFMATIGSRTQYLKLCFE